MDELEDAFPELKSRDRPTEISVDVGKNIGGVGDNVVKMRRRGPVELWRGPVRVGRFDSAESAAEFLKLGFDAEVRLSKDRTMIVATRGQLVDHYQLKEVKR